MVKSKIIDLLLDIGLRDRISPNKLMNIWQNEIFTNGTKRNALIKKTKADIVWPIIIIAIDIEKYETILADELDEGQYDDIIRNYKDLIDDCCEKCEFYIRVLYDYKDFKSKGTINQKCLEFAKTHWKNYLDELRVDTDSETQKGLIQIILYSIVRNRLAIQKIKEGVNLL